MKMNKQVTSKRIMQIVSALKNNKSQCSCWKAYTTLCGNRVFPVAWCFTMIKLSSDFVPYNIEGKITDCRLVETGGIFS